MTPRACVRRGRAQVSTRRTRRGGEIGKRRGLKILNWHPPFSLPSAERHAREGISVEDSETALLRFAAVAKPNSHRTHTALRDGRPGANPAPGDPRAPRTRGLRPRLVRGFDPAIGHSVPCVRYINPHHSATFSRPVRVCCASSRCFSPPGLTPVPSLKLTGGGQSRGS